MGERWQDYTPEQAKHIDLSKRLDITAPLNELGERCPWPWDPQQLTGQAIGQYHCPYCGAMVLAGVEHIDYKNIGDGWPIEDGEIDDIPDFGENHG